jgi:hypothetical protein
MNLIIVFSSALYLKKKERKKERKKNKKHKKRKDCGVIF